MRDIVTETISLLLITRNITYHMNVIFMLLHTVHAVLHNIFPVHARHTLVTLQVKAFNLTEFFTLIAWGLRVEASLTKHVHFCMTFALKLNIYVKYFSRVRVFSAACSYVRM